MFHLVIHDAHMRLCHLPWVKLPPWQAGSGQLDVVAERLQVVAGAVAKRYKVTGGMALRKGPSLAERESQITTIILTCIIDYSFLVLKYLCKIFSNARNLPCPAGMATTLASLQLGPQEICHRHESMGDTPRVTWCTQRPGPGEKFEHKQGSKKPTLQHDQLKESCPRVRFVSAFRKPQSTAIQKKTAQLQCKQLRRAVSANNSQLRYSDIQLPQAPQVFSRVTR